MKLFGDRKGARKTRESEQSRFSGFIDFFNKKWVRIVTIVLALIGTGIIGGVAWWQTNIVPPELPSPVIPDRDPLPTFDIIRTPRPVETKPVDVVAHNQRKSGVFTFLFIGRESEGNTDTLMVGMLNTVEKTFNIVSIPRDTMVNVSRNIKKINAAYAMGELTGKGNGILQLKGEIETLIGFIPDYYVLVNYRAFKRLVDTIGGVEFNVPTNMYQVTDDMIIDLPKGPRKLTGDEALQLVRYRGYDGSEGYGNDDYGRMAVQQAFLKAMGKQALSLGNLFKVGEFIDIAQENVTTDLSVNSMTWLADTVLRYGLECLSFHTLPTESARYNKGWYEHVLEEEALEMINSTINPYVRDITIEDLDISKLSN